MKRLWGDNGTTEAFRREFTQWARNHGGTLVDNEDDAIFCEFGGTETHASFEIGVYEAGGQHVLRFDTIREEIELKVLAASTTPRSCSSPTRGAGSSNSTWPAGTGVCGNGRSEPETHRSAQCPVPRRVTATSNSRSRPGSTAHSNTRSHRSYSSSVRHSNRWSTAYEVSGIVVGWSRWTRGVNRRRELPITAPVCARVNYPTLLRSP